MERKKYMTEVYSKRWNVARVKHYGFLQYDKNLCNYVCQHVPKGSRLLEVAIGNGYPIGDFLQKAGYAVHGIDISPYLIEECRRLNPNINCRVGDAEALAYPDNYFDATCCFHSTWYFPNLSKAIDEMVRVTRVGGMVVFDIQNRNNSDTDRIYRRRLSESRGIKRIVPFTQNLATAILRPHTFNWHFLFHSVVYETPTYPESIYGHLGERKVAGFQVMVRKEDESLETRSELGSFQDFDRLIFVITK